MTTGFSNQRHSKACQPHSLFRLGGGTQVAPPALQDRDHVLWQVAFELHELSRAGVRESQGLRMQGLPGQNLKVVFDELIVLPGRQSFDDLGTPVCLVSKQRVANVLHVDPDLVGAPSFEFAFHQTDRAEPLQYPEMGNGVLALLAFQIDRLDLSVLA